MDRMTKQACLKVFWNLEWIGGNLVLKSHLENAKYISHQTQNKFIEAFSQDFLSEVLKNIKIAPVLAVLTDATADIGGVEQLSIGIWYICLKQKITAKVMQNFIGYVPVTDLDSNVGFLTKIQMFKFMSPS